MSQKPIKVLLIEDDFEDADFLRELLAAETDPSFEVEHVERLESGLKRLTQGGIDVVLLDLSLPDAQGLETTTKVHGKAPQVPIVVLTGLDDDTLSLEIVRRGAQDYLVKGRVDGMGLSRVMRYAMERKRLDLLKDEFVNTVSHELRTPLSVVKQGITLMVREVLGPTNPDQREFLQMMDENVNRLIELINNLLDLSKMQAGRLPLARREVDLNVLLEQTLKRFQLIAGSRTLKLEGLNVPVVFADPDRILQVFGNLLSNAIKFTRDTGTVTIRLKEEGGRVEVSVKDDGIGIAPDDLPKLFQKFSQVGTGNSQQRGTGLGLSLCKEMVQLHNGTLTVSSVLGQGSVFTFTLPLYSHAFALEAGFKRLMDSSKTGGEETVGMVALPVEFLHPKDLPLLAELEAVIRGQVHPGDVVLGLKPYWIVVLALTDGAGVKALGERLHSVLLSWAKNRIGGGIPASVPVGTSLYPVEALDVHELFAKATEAAHGKSEVAKNVSEGT